jgi:hypothetical protein
MGQVLAAVGLLLGSGIGYALVQRARWRGRRRW